MYVLTEDVIDAANKYSLGLRGIPFTDADIKDIGIDDFRHAYEELPDSKAEVYKFDNFVVMINLADPSKAGMSSFSCFKTFSCF